MRFAAALVALVLVHTPTQSEPLNATKTVRSTMTPHLRFLFPMKEGVFGVGPEWIWRSTDSRLFNAYLPYGRGLLRAVAVGERLILAHENGVDVVTVGEPPFVERAPFTDAIGPEWTMAGPLAVGSGQALALTKRRGWRLGSDGKWTSSAHGIPDELHRLAHANGVWAIDVKQVVAIYE